jgi:hypothetical protein
MSSKRMIAKVPQTTDRTVVTDAGDGSSVIRAVREIRGWINASADGTVSR